jgi:EpsD family peptidyl-prolyl cis-trans isomerase
MNARVNRRAVPKALRWVAVAVASAALLSACGDKQEKEKPATQTAAKVNKEEITVHQINAVLSQQRGLKPEQTDEAGRRVLERLIDQELAVQKAAELKVDRDPRVLQAVEAARREIIARAYSEKLGEGAPQPSPEEIKKYYDEHPALFKERRVYQLQEVGIEAPAEQMAAIGARLKAAKNANEFVEYLKANNVKYVTNQAVRAAEQIPMAALPTVAKLKDGEAMLTPTPTGASVVFLAASRAQPVDEERASKAIATYLLNERKRKLITDDVKALRGSAKIEYAGKYAASAPVAETFRAPTPAEVAASAAAALDNKSINEGLGLKSSAGAAAASAVQAADAAVRPASGVDAATITKGLGLK